MSLYKKVKEHIPQTRSVVSEDDFILIDRKDYHLSQVSNVNGLLKALDVNCGYPYRVLLAFLDQFAQNIRGDFNIIIGEPGLSLAALMVWIRAGGALNRGRIYAPKGCPKFPVKAGILQDLTQEFEGATVQGAKARPDEGRKDLFTFVLGNTKTAEQTLLAVDHFTECNRGLLMLKDFTKLGNFDEREYLESKRIFPGITFEGHAFVLRSDIS